MEPFPLLRCFTPRCMKNDLSGSMYNFCFSNTMILFNKRQHMWFGILQKNSLIWNSADTWSIKFLKKVWSVLRKKSERTLGPYNTLMKSKSLSPDGEPGSLLVSSSNWACAYAHTESIENLYCLLSLASCVTQSFSGKSSNDWSVFELGCLASKTILVESFFLIKVNGFRKVIP